MGCIDQSKYATIIGNFMFVMHCIKPNIAYAVGVLSRYTHNLGY